MVTCHWAFPYEDLENCEVVMRDPDICVECILPPAPGPLGAQNSSSRQLHTWSALHELLRGCPWVLALPCWHVVSQPLYSSLSSILSVTNSILWGVQRWANFVQCNVTFLGSRWMYVLRTRSSRSRVRGLGEWERKLTQSPLRFKHLVAAGVFTNNVGFFE